MLSLVRRALIGAVVLALGVTLLAAPAQARLTPPATAATSVCHDVPAGYYPLAGTASGWTWSGNLNLKLCVVKGTGGWIWARSWLALPADGVHDRFTGQWRISLQGCYSTGQITVTETTETWDNSDHPLYDQAEVVDGRYRFESIYTNNIGKVYASYRVVARATAASVVSNNPWTPAYSLASGGLNSQQTYVSRCMSI